MSRKIIGVTVGTTLPKPDFKQTDPTKGDYIKNKPDFDGLAAKVDVMSNLIGDTSVSEQISIAIDEINIPVDSVNGKTGVVVLTAADIGADASGSAASALDNAKSYTDTKISELIDSAPTTLDTLGEIASAMKTNSDVVAALDTAIGKKANASDLISVQTQLGGLSSLVGDYPVSEQISHAVSQKSQVQIITWEADD